MLTRYRKSISEIVLIVNDATRRPHCVVNSSNLKFEKKPEKLLSAFGEPIEIQTVY